MFKEIRGLLPEDIDHNILTWVKCSGIPCHAWNDTFFEHISATLGSFVHRDDNTKAKVTIDASRFRILTNCATATKENIQVLIDGTPFRISLVEEMCNEQDHLRTPRVEHASAVDEVSSNSMHSDEYVSIAGSGYSEKMAAKRKV